MTTTLSTTRPTTGSTQRGSAPPPTARPTTSLTGLAASDSFTRRRLLALLHEHGLRCTTQRMAVLTLLAARDGGHLSATTIHQRLRASGNAMDRATVYRTLTLLADIGVLHGIAFNEQPTSYGVTIHAHHHVLCSRCGQVCELPAEQLRGVLDQARRASHFTLDDTSITLRGLCPPCQNIPEHYPGGT